MARTEERKRLLWKGEIVGFKWDWLIDDDLIICQYSHQGNWNNIPAQYDSFELGIKDDNGFWWFEGDIGIETGSRPPFELVHDGLVFKMKYIFINHADIIRTVDRIEMLSNCNCIGNIHDNPELMRN